MPKTLKNLKGRLKILRLADVILLYLENLLKFRYSFGRNLQNHFTQLSSSKFNELQFCATWLANSGLKFLGKNITTVISIGKSYKKWHEILGFTTAKKASEASRKFLHVDLQKPIPKS